MLLDVAPLIALLWENHEHHGRARRWLRQQKEFSTCPLGQLGFGRISSQPELGFAPSPDIAFSMLRGFLADPRHRFVPDDLCCDARSLFSEDMRSSRAVTDHYLVALARQHKLALATFDVALFRAFRHEPGLVELIP